MKPRDRETKPIRVKDDGEKEPWKLTGTFLPKKMEEMAKEAFRGGEDKRCWALI